MASLRLLTSRSALHQAFEVADIVAGLSSELPLLLQHPIPAGREVEECDAEGEQRVVGWRAAPDHPLPCACQEVSLPLCFHECWMASDSPRRDATKFETDPMSCVATFRATYRE